MKVKYYNLLFPLLAFFATIFVSKTVFLNQPITTDENSYVFQANSFAQGKLKREAPFLKEPFRHKHIIMDEHAGWLSRYAPGHSLWLTPGTFLGNERLMVSVGAFFSILLLFFIARELQISPLLMQYLGVLSPFFLFMHGTLLSHTSGLIASSLMLLFYLRWKRTCAGKDIVICGLSWAFLYLNRTYTAALLAPAFGFDVFFVYFKKRQFKILIHIFLFMFSSFSGVLILMAYNYLAIKDPFTPTYLYYEPSEKLGFGLRHLQGLAVEHSFQKGLSFLRNNLKLLDQWLFGIKGTLGGVVVLFILGWNFNVSLLLIMAILFVCFGYTYFWYPGPFEVGPGYYFELFPFLLTIIAMGLNKVWGFIKQRSKRYFCIACLVVIASFLISILFMNVERRKIRRTVQYRARIQKTIKSAPVNSLILLEDIPFPDVDMLNLNKNGLNSDPLVVRSNYESHFVIASFFKKRTPLVLRKNQENSLIPFKFNKSDELIRYLVSQTKKQVGKNIQIPKKSFSLREANQEIDKKGFLSFGKYILLAPGKYQIIFKIVEVNAPKTHPHLVEVYANNGVVSLGEKEVSGESFNLKEKITITLDSFQEIEPRVVFSGYGRLSLKNIRIKKIKD